MVPVCDKLYHIYNRFRHFWAEIKKLWNYPLKQSLGLKIFFYFLTMSLFMCKYKLVVKELGYYELFIIIYSLYLSKTRKIA